LTGLGSTTRKGKTDWVEKHSSESEASDARKNFKSNILSMMKENLICILPKKRILKTRGNIMQISAFHVTTS